MVLLNKTKAQIKWIPIFETTAIRRIEADTALSLHRALAKQVLSIEVINEAVIGLSTTAGTPPFHNHFRESLKIHNS